MNTIIAGFQFNFLYKTYEHDLHCRLILLVDVIILMQ